MDLATGLVEAVVEVRRVRVVEERADLGFGRTPASGIEAPNMFVNLV